MFRNAVSNVRAGDSFTVIIDALDAQAVPQLAENFNGTVSLGANVPAGGSGFASTPSEAATAGTASFASLQLLNSANGYNLSATSSPRIPATSNLFDVTARTLVIGNVSNVRAGDVFGVSVTAVDAQSTPQTAENFNGNVSLTAGVPAGGSGFAVAPGPAGASAGSVTFGNLQLLNAADGYTVSASSSGLIGGTSNSFNTTARTLVFRDPLENAKSGSPLTVEIDGLDAQAIPQLAENFDAQVTLAASATGGSDFALGNTVNASNGTADFSGVELNNAADGYTIQATSPGVISATSNVFDVTADHLVIMQVIADLVVGEDFDVTAQARDANDNIAENFTSNVTLTAAAPAGSNFVGGSPDQNATAGVAEFSDLVLDDPAPNYRITASNAGLTNALSNKFEVHDFEVQRTLFLDLRRHLKAIGALGTDGPVRCVDDMSVLIQRRKRSGKWATVKAATTNGVGDYAVKLPDRRGTYRAKAPRRNLLGPATACLRATSSRETHRHN